MLPFAAVASAHEHELLAEVNEASGNAPEIARRILRRLPTEPGRRSYAYENGFSFHFLTEGRLIFLCMEKGLDPPKAFAFLVEMQQSWRTQFAGTRGSSSFKDFNHILADLRSDAERGVQGDEDLDEVNAKLLATKAVMSDSIEKVLERGEKIELLVDKTEHLQNHAFRFAKSSTQLKRNLVWQSRKCLICAFCGLAAVVLTVVFTACGGQLSTCFGSTPIRSTATKVSTDWTKQM
jgi:vesicle-associated membrane protein 7